MNDERKDAWFIDRIKACLQAHMDGDTGIIGSVVALTGLGGDPREES